MFVSKELPPIPVYVDSPLAVSATEIYRLHPDSCNVEVYAALFVKQNPFGFEDLTLIRSKALNELEGVSIIISASGMCEAGRIMHHLRNNIEDPKPTVLFVGYYAARTLGRRIRDGKKVVRILGDEFNVNAKIEIVDSFSGHADHSELDDYYNRIEGEKTGTWLIHGESDSCQALEGALRETGGKVSVGELGKTVEF